MSRTKKKLLVVDCDTGTDDAQAIMMALAQPSDTVQLCAITTTFGNAPLHNTALNTLRVLKICGRLDIPVYKGASLSVLGNPSCSNGFHGKDGLGDCTMPGIDPVDAGLLQKEHAAVALVKMASERPGEYTLVATGPLTNVATALKLDPDFGSNLKACYIMGGSSNGRGNIKPTAEFNIYSDPEAAHIVFKQLGTIINLAPVDVCQKYSWTWEEYDKFLQIPTEKCKYVKIFEKVMTDQQKKENDPTYILWDQVAMAAALNESVVTETKEVYVTVELSGAMTRGQMIVDWNNHFKKKPNVRLIYAMDKVLYEKLVYQGVDG